jgi:hypothetical protein
MRIQSGGGGGRKGPLFVRTVYLFVLTAVSAFCAEARKLSFKGGNVWQHISGSVTMETVNGERKGLNIP